MLLLRRAASQVDSVGQLLDRDFGIAGCQTAQTPTRMHQDIGQGVADKTAHLDGIYHHAGKLIRDGLRKDLRQNLTKEQQKEGHQHRLDDKLEGGIVEDKERVDDV